MRSSKAGGLQRDQFVKHGKSHAKLNKFLIDQILKIRSTIKSLPQKDVDIKEYIHPNLEVTLKSFKPVDEDEVRKIISASFNVSAIHDPFHTRLIKDNLDTLLQSLPVLSTNP